MERAGSVRFWNCILVLAVIRQRRSGVKGLFPECGHTLGFLCGLFPGAMASPPASQVFTCSRFKELAVYHSPFDIRSLPSEMTRTLPAFSA